MRRELYSPAQQAAMAEREDAIVALLEERPYTTGELGELFEVTSGMGQICGGLARQGRIVRLPDNRWALPGNKSSSTTEHGPVLRTRPAGETILAALEFGPLTAYAIAEQLSIGRRGVQNRLDDLLRQGQVKRLNDQGRMIWALPSYQSLPPAKVKTTSGDQVLRQPYERPPSQTVKKEDALSWWCGLSRQELAAGVRARQESMHQSREARMLPLRILQ